MPRRRHALFFSYCLSVALANAGVLRALYELSRDDESASHIVLIPVITLALAYQCRRSISAAARWNWPAGLAVVLLGMALSVAARLSPQLGAQTGPSTLMVAAIVVMWLGGFLLFYGGRAFRSAMFPLLFLGFMIPIPASVLEGVVRFLKIWSTEMASALFTVTATPYHREGFVLTLPRFAIEVADECSGIRSSLALLLTALIAAYTSLRTPWKRALCVLAVVPIAIFKNGLRIVTLSLLAMHVHPGFLTGRLHHEGGIVFFLMTLAIVYPFFALLVNSERKTGAMVASVPRGRSSSELPPPEHTTE